MSSLWLKEHRLDVTSQNGEDGVLEAILQQVEEKNSYCCEFGAWDGKLYSNTYNLISQGWSGVLMEADPDRFRELKANMQGFPKVTTICTVVQEDLDSLLKNTKIPKDFDILSIDIDGADYHAWKTLEEYRPRIVIIEVNSSLFDVEVVPPVPDGRLGMGIGTSINSMVALGKQKGYELALHTGNAIFVTKELAAELSIDTENWRELFDRSWL